MRGGTVTVPVALSHVVALTTGSLPEAWTGDSASRCPARSATVCVVASSDPLTTTRTPSSVRSTSLVQRRVVEAYREVLRRDPDPAGLVTWTNEIASGRLRQEDLRAVLDRLTTEED